MKKDESKACSLPKDINLFEIALSVPVEDIEIELRGQCPVPWADFLLNPRRLRGSDFLMRWSQGVWSEKRLIQAVNETGKYFALPYGLAELLLTRMCENLNFTSSVCRKQVLVVSNALT